jgi:hypothetical protein
MAPIPQVATEIRVILSSVTRTDVNGLSS